MNKVIVFALAVGIVALVVIGLSEVGIEVLKGFGAK